MELTINEIISNMRDELERTSSLLDWLSNEYPQIYKKIQDSELGDELKQDIENDLERTNDIDLDGDFNVVETTTYECIAYINEGSCGGVFYDFDSAEDYAIDNKEKLEEGEYLVIYEIKYQGDKEVSCRIIKTYEWGC